MDLTTDEELAEMERTSATGAMLASSSWGRRYSDDVPRLVAALRAAREQVERLKGYDHAAFFPTLVVPAGGVTIGGPLPEPLLLIPAPPED